MQNADLTRLSTLIKEYGDAQERLGLARSEWGSADYRNRSEEFTSAGRRLQTHLRDVVGSGFTLMSYLDNPVVTALEGSEILSSATEPPARNGELTVVFPLREILKLRPGTNARVTVKVGVPNLDSSEEGR